MTPDPESQEDLAARLRVLEKENELLAERAEDITLLGLVAEQTQAQGDPLELLSAVLERVCILKAVPYGACLRAEAGRLVPVAAYHVRRAEAGSRLDRFPLAGAWPPQAAQVLDALDLARLFPGLEIPGPAFGPLAGALVPFPCATHPEGGLLFLDDHRPAGDFAALLPLLERVADLARARLDNLSLVAQLQAINLGLDREVEARTQELRRSEERYRTLFDHVPDGVLLVAAEGAGGLGRIRDANEAAARMHGYQLDELRGMDLEALAGAGTGAPQESFEARIWRLQPGQTVQEELVHRRRDGSSFPVESIGTLVHLLGQQYILGFYRDISARHQAEAALRRSQRSESVGLLAGGIAHDFNNLLTAIMGQTGLAMARLEPGSWTLEHLQKAMSAADKAALLTRQMLAYSGRGHATIAPLLLNDVVRANLQFLEASIPKQVRFQLDLEDRLPPVVADAGQIQQVIMNLVINGAEAIGERPGSITVRTRFLHLPRVDPERWPLGGLALAPGDYVAIEVADTGAGMSPAVLARVFDPFFTTKAKGHGLGLAAVQGIIRGHRGGLGVDSAPGAGTTFHILLPAGLEGQVPEPSRPASAAPGGRVVLAVDDEAYLLDLVAECLESRGHTCLRVASGEQALALVEASAADLDVVLLDLTMPGLGGVETLRQLAARHPELPVILTSGFAEEEAVAHAWPQQPAHFLQKPFSALDLARAIEAFPARAR